MGSKATETTKKNHQDNLVVKRAVMVSESSWIQPQGMGACSLNHPEEVRRRQWTGLP